MSLKLLKRCNLLKSIGDGLASRCYLFGSNLPVSILGDPSIQKILARIEKKFPDIKGLDKSNGYDIFVKRSSEIVQTLEPFALLLRDLNDFFEISLASIKDLIDTVPQFEYSLSRNYCILMCNLVSLHIKLVLILTKITDSKKLFGLYSSAYELINLKAEPNFTSISKLFEAAVDNHNRYFIDTFYPFQDVLGVIISQFQDSIVIGNDISYLRNNYILNFAVTGQGIEAPSNRNLNSNNQISLYSELSDFDNLCELTLYVYIACPGLLYNPSHFELFLLISSETLSIKIHNGIVLNLHEEFNSISLVYPSKTDKYEYSKGFSLKTSLRDIAKHATKNCGAKKSKRRAIIKEELENINKLIACIPGALAPKFPQIMAAASLARSEILSYFRHLGLETRKDCSKHLKAEHFKTSTLDTPNLLAELMKLNIIVMQSRIDLVHYYISYLSKTDELALGKLSEDLVSYASDNFKELLGSVQRDLRILRPGDILSTFNNNNNVSNNIQSVESTSILGKLRTRCEQLLAYVLQKSSVDRSVPIPTGIAEDLTKRLRGIIERSLIADSLESYLMPSYFDPIEIWYFQDYFLDAYMRTLKDFSTDSCSSLYFFRIVSRAAYNLHPDCPGEFEQFYNKTTSVCDQMLLEYTAHFKQILEQLEVKITGLDSQLYPIEAAYRAERSLIAKKSGNIYLEPYPGSESKSWAIQSIKQLVYLRAILIEFIESAKRMDSFVVYNREYSLINLTRVHIEQYFEFRLKFYFENIRAEYFFDDLSVALRTIDSILQGTQYTFSLVNTDFPIFLRESLFSIFCPTSLAPPGAPIPLSLNHDADINNSQALWSFGKILLQLLENMAESKSNYIWNNSLKIFANKHQHPNSKDDIKKLCNYMGPQGIRAVSYRIGKFIAEKVKDIKEFLSVNNAVLSELRRDFCSSINAAHKLQNLTGFTSNLISIGLALALRDRFLSSLYDSTKHWIPSTCKSIESLVNSIDVWNETKGKHGDSLYQMASDLGLTSTSVSQLRDISLHQLIQTVLFSEGEEKDPQQSRLYELLPVAFAASFMSDRWDNSKFDTEMAIFHGNEHAISLSFSKLMIAILSNAFSNSNEGGSTKFMRIKESAELFLEIASHIFAVMRAQESQLVYKCKPLRAMISVLESTVTQFPEGMINRSSLEKHYPYAMIHSDFMDIALGKITFSDTIDTSVFDSE